MGERLTTGDVVLASAIAVLAQVEVWTTMSSPDRYPCAAAGAIAAIALLWRRSRPVTTFMAAAAAAVLVSATTPSEGLWPIAVLVIVLYSTGRHAPPRRAVGLLVIALAIDAFTISREDNSSVGMFLGNYAFIAVLMIVIPWGAGYALQQRERDSLRVAATAVDQERRRIARELHDVVGHSLGVIAVQAGAERATLPADASDSTRETLTTIEETTRQTLTEMRRLLAVMRGDDTAPRPLAPQPTLAEVETLAHSADAAGLNTDLRIEGDVVALSPGVDLTAFRIVQESLTNAVRHSHGTSARVTIRYCPHEIELEIVDDGAGESAMVRGGYGLAGIRERVALYGGSVTTGAHAAGGFAVRARLPYTASAP